MKAKTVLKIAFCVLLIAAVTFAALGKHSGADKLHAQCTDFRNSDFFEKALNEIIQEGKGEDQICEQFGIDRDYLRGKLLSQYDNIYGTRMEVSACNKNKFDITVVGLEVITGEGKDPDSINYTHFSRTPEEAVTIPAGTKESVSVWFSVMTSCDDNDELLSYAQKRCTFKLLYVDAATGITALADADENVLHKEWIRN